MGNWDKCCDEWRVEVDDGEVVVVVNASVLEMLSHSVAMAVVEKFIVQYSMKERMDQRDEIIW